MNLGSILLAASCCMALPAHAADPQSEGSYRLPFADGTTVRVFDGTNVANVLRDFMAYDLGFLGGVSVAALDIDGDGKADIITGAGGGGGPHVRVFSGATAGLELRSFFAFDPGFLGGVSVG